MHELPSLMNTLQQVFVLVLIGLMWYVFLLVGRLRWKHLDSWTYSRVKLESWRHGTEGEFLLTSIALF